MVIKLTLIFGGWILLTLKSPVPALALLILLKLAVDLGAHRREHSVKTQEKQANRTPMPRAAMLPLPLAACRFEYQPT